MPERKSQDEQMTDASPELIGGAPPQSSGDTAAASVDRERIARRAYELYLARGGADGYAEDDWLTAERECRDSGE